jgi:hypothetical protein
MQVKLHPPAASSAKSVAVHPVPPVRAHGGINASRMAEPFRNQSMPIKRFSPRLLVLVCGLGLSLGGCVAIPLAQMAISRAPSADPACTGCATNAAAGPMGDISKGVSDSFHKWTGGAPAEATPK